MKTLQQNVSNRGSDGDFGSDGGGCDGGIVLVLVMMLVVVVRPAGQSMLQSVHVTKCTCCQVHML